MELSDPELYFCISSDFLRTSSNLALSSRHSLSLNSSIFTILLYSSIVFVCPGYGWTMTGGWALCLSSCFLSSYTSDWSCSTNFLWLEFLASMSFFNSFNILWYSYSESPVSIWEVRVCSYRSLAANCLLSSSIFCNASNNSAYWSFILFSKCWLFDFLLEAYSLDCCCFYSLSISALYSSNYLSNPNTFFLWVVRSSFSWSFILCS